MLTPTRTMLALTILAACLSIGSASALAVEPASVSVRVLGPSPAFEALTPLTTVTTTTAPVVNDGNAAHSCAGTSAAGALQLATKGDWAGKWYEGEGEEPSGYFVESVDGFAPPNGTYWFFWLNDSESPLGICAAGLEANDQLLFVPESGSEYGSAHILGLAVPAVAEVGVPVTVTVSSYNAKGEPTPLNGANVTAGDLSAKTEVQGHAQLTFTADGTYTLRASGASGENPVSIPGEAIVCAHTGSDGNCGVGTSTPSHPGSSPTTTSLTATVTPYTGPYEIVAAITGIGEQHVYSAKNAPRLLTGTISAHSAVTSISLRLRRSYGGRCWAFEGARERFVRARCGQGSFFHIASGGERFSYLLPSKLPPGRYVLDVQGSDAAGQVSTLDRGTSRVVFHVG